MKTYSMKGGEVTRDCYLIDANGVVLGRLASAVAKIIRGKHKPSYTPHMNCGDQVIVINAGKVAITGNKAKDDQYHRHTGYPGGIKTTTRAKMLDSKHPERVIQLAVKRMLPKEGPLCRMAFRNLKVYAGAEHPHEAQQPKVIDFASLNEKNKRS